MDAAPLETEPGKAPAVEGRRYSWAGELVVFLGFLAVSVFATWPLSRHAATRLPFNLIDPLLNAWIFSWAGHALAHAPLELFDANVFFPDRFTLLFTESDLGQSIPLAPLYWLTGNGVLVVNVAAILMYAIGGYGAYLVAREFGATRPAAFLGGVIFGVAPYRLSQIVHVHVVAIHLAPFVLLYLVRLRTRPSRRVVYALGAALGLQFWSSLSGGAITLCLVGVWVLWELAFHRRAGVPVLVAAGKGGLLAAVIVVPLIVPYLIARSEHPEYTHPSGEALVYSATLRSYISPTEGGALARDSYQWLARQSRPEVAAWEKHLFPGWAVSVSMVVLGAGAAGSFARRRRPRPSWVAPAALAIGVSVIAGVLSLGPRLGASPDGPLLPFELLNRLMPGRLFRVPARFGSIVPLGLGLFVAVIVSQVRPSRQRWLVGALALALAAELAPSQIPTVRVPDITAAHRSIAALPGAVLALPAADANPDGSFGAVIDREPIHLYLSTGHFRPLVNGYSAFEPTTWQAVTRAVQDFPTVPSLRLLRHYGVRTVVVQTSLAEGTKWQDSADRLSRWPGTRLVARGDGVVVFDISAARY